MISPYPFPNTCPRCGDLCHQCLQDDLQKAITMNADLLAALEATLNYPHPTWCRSRRSEGLPCSCYQRNARAAIEKAEKENP